MYSILNKMYIIHLEDISVICNLNVFRFLITKNLLYRAVYFIIDNLDYVVKIFLIYKYVNV